MSGYAASLRALGASLVAAAAAALLWLGYGLIAQDPLLGSSPWSEDVRLGAIAVSAAAAVLVLNRLVHALIFRPALGREATGLQRMLIFCGLAFVASFVALRQLGIDPRTVLATSAIVTAALGLALHSTLSGLVSGLYVQLDSVLHVGDRIEYEGAPATVVSINWRTTQARRADGALIVMTNARLAENPVVIRRKDQGLRLLMTAPAAVEATPTEVAEIVTGILADLAPVDLDRKITVVPSEFQPDHGLTIYQIGAWLVPDADLLATKGEVLSRLWYGYARAGLRLPTSLLVSGRHEDRLFRELGDALAPYLGEPAAGSAAGETLPPGFGLLPFAPGERLVLPELYAGCRFVVLRGGAVAGAPGGRWSPSAEIAGEAQGRRLQAHRLAKELSGLIGPYGEHAVWSAAAEASGAADLRRRVAETIGAEGARADFLSLARPETSPSHGPGAVLSASRDPFGALSCRPALRATAGLVLLAVPASAWDRLQADARPAAA